MKKINIIIFISMLICSTIILIHYILNDKYTEVDMSDYK